MRKIPFRWSLLLLPVSFYFLSRINALAKQFGHTLTNQWAEHTDSIYLSRTFSSSPFWKSWQSESTQLAAKKDLSRVLSYGIPQGRSSLKITLLQPTHRKEPALRLVTGATCYSDTPFTNSRTNILPATPKRTFSHSESSLLLQ